MDIYHTKISVSDQAENVNMMAMAPLFGYKKHLEQGWPEIKDQIEIGFIKGTNFSEICFSHNLGWDDTIWLSFLRFGIALPIALENCKKYGIKRFIFLCNDEIRDSTPEELQKAFLNT